MVVRDQWGVMRDANINNSNFILNVLSNFGSNIDTDLVIEEEYGRGKEKRRREKERQKRKGGKRKKEGRRGEEMRKSDG